MRVVRLQPLEVGGGVLQSVRMINPQAVDATAGEQLQDEAVGVLEHDRILDANGREVVDVEEAPVIDLGRRDPPVGEPVRLCIDQAIERIEALGDADDAVEGLHGALDRLIDRAVRCDDLRKPLPQILRAQNASSRTSHKAVINIFLGGGPPHQDMWEIKTEAPKEIRGEFDPIATNVPGIEIGECFPRIAALMDKCVVIRSVTGCVDQHDAYMCLSGWTRR